MEGTIRVSELIQKLQDILKQHGDLKVFLMEFGGAVNVHDVEVDTIGSNPEKHVFIE